MKILVADDDRISRELLVRTLKEWDHEPVHARDGIEALKVLREENPPTLMILDWMMPGMSGADVCRFVRKICTNNPYVYILVLTGRKEKKDLIEALEAAQTISFRSLLIRTN
ncbi:response regulator [bacterium]|nr:response regulator [bacterium]